MDELDSPELRPRGRVCSWGAVFVALLLAHSSLARAVEEPGELDGPVDPRGRFAGFVDAAPHVVVQRSKGSVDTSFGIQSSKSNILTNMTFRLGGGLKAPAIDAVLGKPRPVVWAAALVPINESSTIGTRFFLDESVPGFQRTEFSKFSVEYQTSALAGLGVEFEIPVFDTAIAITPALETLHLATRYVGSSSIQIDSLGNSDVSAVRTKKEIFQHYLGPALRIAAPTIVVRGIAIDFFLEGSVLFDIAGTRRTPGARGPNGETGSFSFEAGSGVAQIGSGLQLRFP